MDANDYFKPTAGDTVWVKRKGGQFKATVVSVSSMGVWVRWKRDHKGPLGMAVRGKAFFANVHASRFEAAHAEYI
jgi:hypothetical protein